MEDASILEYQIHAFEFLYKDGSCLLALISVIMLNCE